MLIETLDQFEHFEQLVAEVKDLVERVPFQEPVYQLALQTDNPDVTDWYTSCGRVEKVNSRINEMDYQYIQPELKGSYIEQWINSFSKPLFRTRLLFMNPRTCYSIHKDYLPRIHLPVTTNPQCLMCFPQHGIMQFLQNTGHSYWVDTRQMHTFMNCSEHTRIHLVAVVSDDA
jgi:hypothetical protein